MKVEAVEAKLYHCGRLARLLRPVHRDVLLRHGSSIHKDLKTTFVHSSYRQAWLIDGKIAALAGVIGSTADFEATVWMAISDHAAKMAPNAVSREALRFMARVSRTKSLINISILAEDEASTRFAYFLGFTVDRRETIEGIPVIMMRARTRKAA